MKSAHMPTGCLLSGADAKACSYLGRTLHMLAEGDTPRMARSQALLYRAIALDESYSLPHYFIALLLLSRGDTSAARHHAEHAATLDPTDTDAGALQNRLSQSVGLETVPIGAIASQIRRDLANKNR